MRGQIKTAVLILFAPSVPCTLGRYLLYGGCLVCGGVYSDDSSLSNGEVTSRDRYVF